MIYERMRRIYMEENHPEEYRKMKANGTLEAYLKKFEDEAFEREYQLKLQLAKAQGVTEEIKRKDQLLWVGMMNNCQSQAREIVIAEMVES